MSMTRESFFECSCVSEGRKRTAQVRAWTASGARRMFLDLLASEGLRDPGNVTVTPVRYHEALPSPHLAFATAPAGNRSRS